MPDRKFTTLRKRLDQLGYRQPLVIEAIPLVEKLFSDLVHTTESFKNYKAKVKVSEESGVSDLSEPYRNDNARLVAENNELHQDLIKTREEVDKLTVEMKSAMQKLENQNQDLRFLNSQYIVKIKGLEKESKHKSDRIIAIEEQNMNAVVETPGGKKKNIPSRRQRMNLESTLSHSESYSTLGNTMPQTADPYVADLLGIADNRIEDMKQHISAVESEKEKLEKKCRSTRKQVDSRDKEIARLNKMLEGGRPVDAVLSDGKSTSSNRVVAHLNIQVDYLQQANQDMEKKVSKLQETKDELEVSVRRLKDRNDELCMELAAMDKLYKSLGKEKKKYDGDIEEQLNSLKQECEDKQRSIIDLQANAYNLKKERDDLIDENEQLNCETKEAKQNKANVLELYERCDKEKRRLTEKNAKLTVAERELAMELERVKISKGILPKKPTDRLDYLVRNLEDDRDHYKNELNELQKLMHKHIFTKTDHSVKKEGNAMVQLMQEERDYYKKEYELLKSFKNTRLHSPPTKDQEYGRAELSRMRQERDELQKMLKSFEKHLEQIQENVKSVSVERDNVQLLYEQASEEIRRLRRKQAQVLSPSRKITDILQKAEKERDEAIGELRRARLNIKHMKTEIKTVQKHYESDKTEHHTKQRDVEDLLDKMENDNNNLNDRVSSTQNMINTLEDQLSCTNKSMRKLNETLNEKNAELSRLKLLLVKSDQANEELRQKLEEKASQLGTIQKRNSNLQETQNSSEQKLNEFKKEIKRLKKVASSLDRERDELQREIDDKSEKLVQLDDGLRRHEEADTELKFNMEEMQENLRYRDEELQSKEREILGLEKQVHCMEEELAAMSRSREGTVRENKRLLDDLSLMTEDNQELHKQLQDATAESHNLKQQIEGYAMHVRQIEDLLSQKDLEKEELLLQYKTLSNKADILETNRQHSEGENESVKQNLLHTHQEINYLQERCSILEAQIEQHISTEESYEEQIQALQQSVGNLETQLRSTEVEKDSILEDLYAVRELCVRLDQTREELTNKIATKTTRQEELEEMIKATDAESQVTKKQILQEKEHVKSLENIIASTREKQFLEKRLHEDGLLDLENVKCDLLKVERERSQKGVENANLRKQNVLFQEEVATLRQQITSEKYERERMKQELRRKSHSPVPEKAAATSYANNTDAIYTTTNTFLTDSTKVAISSTTTNRNVSFSPLQVTFSSDDEDVDDLKIT